MPLDLLLRNATILTMDAHRPIATAVGVERGRIVWVGDAAEARDQQAGARRVLDLAGATVVPGFNDAHNHLILLGHWLSQVDCSFPAVQSIGDIVTAIAARAPATSAGAWIEGRGYDDNRLAEHRPHHPLGPRRGHTAASRRDHPRLGPYVRRQQPRACRRRHRPRHGVPIRRRHPPRPCHGRAERTAAGARAGAARPPFPAQGQGNAAPLPARGGRRLPAAGHHQQPGGRDLLHARIHGLPGGLAGRGATASGCT